MRVGNDLVFLPPPNAKQGSHERRFFVTSIHVFDAKIFLQLLKFIEKRVFFICFHFLGHLAIFLMFTISRKARFKHPEKKKKVLIKDSTSLPGGLYQFDDRHRAGIALAITDTVDAGVSAFRLLIFRTQFLEQLLERSLLFDG